MEQFVRFLARVFFGVFYKVDIKGMENVPTDGGLILCANHIGELDMFFIAYKMKRLVHYMAKAELFKSPILAFILKGIGAFPVKRGKGDIGAAKTVYKFLKEGEIVGILPEGTRTRGKDPSSIKVKSGAALFAVSSGVPILPVAVHGSYKLFTKVKVVIGMPFYLDTEPHKKYSTEELANMSEDIMKRIYSLLEEK